MLRKSATTSKSLSPSVLSDLKDLGMYHARGTKGGKIARLKKKTTTTKKPIEVIIGRRCQSIKFHHKHQHRTRTLVKIAKQLSQR